LDYIAIVGQLTTRLKTSTEPGNGIILRSRHSQTFRPEVLFAFGQTAFGFFPEFFNFGVARINSRTGELTVEIRDIAGVVKGSRVIGTQ